MNKRRKLLNVCLCLMLLVPFLNGCYDRIELEGMAFVVSLGLDKGPGNTVDVTARIAVPSKLAGSGGEQVISGAKPITVRAETVSGALNLLNTTVERRISMLHLANLVISESLAKDGLIKYIRPLTRYREFRRTVQLFIVKGKVRQVYEANQPVLEQSVTRFTESVEDVGRHTGLSANTKLHEFVEALETPNEDPVIAEQAVNPKVLAQEKSKDDPSQDVITGDQLSYAAGKVKRLGGNPLEFVGTAIFRSDKMVLYLNGIESRLLLTLRGEMERTQMDFPDPFENGKFVSLELKHARRPIVNVNLHANPITINIRQTLEGDLIGVQSGIDYTKEATMRALEKAVQKRLQNSEKNLMERVYHEYQAEPFGIFKKTRSQFRTTQELVAYPYRDRLKNCVVNVSVDVHMRRVGVQLAPATVK